MTTNDRKTIRNWDDTVLKWLKVQNMEVMNEERRACFDIHPESQIIDRKEDTMLGWYGYAKKRKNSSIRKNQRNMVCMFYFRSP